MAQPSPVLDPIRFNAAEQCYETIARFDEPRGGRSSYACSIPGTLGMTPDKVRHLLISEAIMRRRAGRGLRSAVVSARTPRFERPAARPDAPAGWLSGIFGTRRAA